MTAHEIVSPQEWTERRRALLGREKEFTRLRDELSQERRNLPWMRVDTAYAFDTRAGRKSLTELFAGRSQLVVYHFMFAPDWDAGCKSCSFWADNFNGIVPHLKQRDVTMIAVSRAPLAKLTAFRERMGWTFDWVSSAPGDFSYDFNVSFRAGDAEHGKAVYNYAPTQTRMSDLPGISVLFRDEAGAIYHTYSCYQRGLDMMNTAYHYLDLVPKGRDEASLSGAMSWVKLRDLYDQ